jgi:hypothetical protein|tara:strand:+ start:23766 stop:24332 length:567 start_codon:yes stop_codon:yes gene_type:complete
MKKKILKSLLLLSFSIILIGLSIYTSHFITINDHSDSKDKFIYLSDNGYHIDIIIPEDNYYYCYGWGSRVFFMETPTWDDVTFNIATQALLTKPESVMREIIYYTPQENWIKVYMNNEQFKIVKDEIAKSFRLENGKRVHLKDNFYSANGNYYFLNTCNTWVNSILKKANLKCRYFTLTSEALIELYK